MKADPSDQRRLLDLQEIDTALAQLAHRRDRLPELAALEELAAERVSLTGARDSAADELADLDRAIARQERDVEQVRARQERDAAMLAAGRGPARELTALQHELDSLRRRQGELEDIQLELMERRERAEAALTTVTDQLAGVDRRTAEAESRRDAALAEIAGQEAAQRAAREPLVAGSADTAALPAPLVALYERIRTDAGGRGAALLRAGRCGGCRLELSGSERGRIAAAPPDEVVRCDECRRIMVRTDESGL